MRYAAADTTTGPPAGSGSIRRRRRSAVVMAKLIYSAIASADGYIEDAAGGFD
jgi:hypothetical protein